MKRKSIGYLVMSFTLGVLAATSNVWVVTLLGFISTNGNLIQSIANFIQIILWICSAIAIGIPRLRKNVDSFDDDRFEPINRYSRPKKDLPLDSPLPPHKPPTLENLEKKPKKDQESTLNLGEISKLPTLEDLDIFKEGTSSRTISTPDLPKFTTPPPNRLKDEVFMSDQYIKNLLVSVEMNLQKDDVFMFDEGLDNQSKDIFSK